MPEPTSLRVPANGLTYNVLEWTAHAAEATVVLIHGFMDAAATWDRVAPRLSAAGFRVLAPDLRGFGDTPPMGAGGYYYFPDYVHDLADLIDALVPADSRLLLVGHSMGGSVATQYAGAFPERPTRLAVLEGAGPPPGKPEDAPAALRRWVEEVRFTRSRGERTFGSRSEALRRLLFNHPKVPPDVLRDRIDSLSRTSADGAMAWKADPLHATRGPIPFSAEGWMAFARSVTCPVLFVSGGPQGWHPPDEEARIGSFAMLERAEIPEAGHMMHWSAPEALSELLLRFFLAA
jgi:pimeloyl-ACP methyl ester carboxylesterase